MDAVLAGRLVAAIIEPVAPWREHPCFIECEQVAPGRWAVAQAIASDADVAEFVSAVQAQAQGGRAAVALGPGSLGAYGPLGDAPHDALRLLADLGAQKGVIVDSLVHRAIGGPAMVRGAGRVLTGSRKSRWWVAAVAAGLTLAVGVLILLNLQRVPDPAAGYIYLYFGEAAVERRGIDRPLRKNDRVQVNLQGTPDQFVSLVLINSNNRLQLPSAHVINHRLTAKEPSVDELLELDDQPGQELLVGVFSPQPLDDLRTVVEVLNAEGKTRLADLRRRLPGAYLVSAEPIEHAP